MLSLKADEKITNLIPVRNFEGDYSLLMATKRGVIKKTPLTDYRRPRAGGIIGINLEDGEAVGAVAKIVESEEDVEAKTETPPTTPTVPTV